MISLSKHLRMYFFLLLIGSSLLALAVKVETKATGAIGQGNDEDEFPAEIQKIMDEAKISYYRFGDLPTADSLATLAVRKADMTYKTGVIVTALNSYMSMNELGYDRAKAMSYAKRAEDLVYQLKSPELSWTTFVNIANVYLDVFDFDKALAFAYKSLTIAEAERDDIMRGRSFNLIGSVQQQNNQVIEAFRYFLNALTIAESSKNSELLRECYKTLSRFYNLNKGFEKAVNYKMKEIDLIQDHKPLDSLSLIWAWCDLEEISINFNNEVHEDRLCEVIQFAIDHRNTYLKQYVLALFRTYLMNTGKFERLRQLYQEKYPEELTYLSEHQPSVYQRLKAIFHELDGEYDEAYESYLRAEELVAQNPNKVMLSNFYIRFGEFLERSGRNAEAAQKIGMGFDFAQEASYLEFSLKASTLLVGLYKELGDFQKAVFYSEHGRAIADSLAKLNRKDEMLALEIQNTAQIRELALQEELLATQRRNNLQYTFIVLAIMGSFVILVMMGSFKVSANTIHFLGFLSFIFLFEFIILLADNYIHHATHGEPLKILGIKIVLIAFLLPLHHWIEKKVTHYLVHKRLIRINRLSLKSVLVNLRATAKEIWAKWD